MRVVATSSIWKLRCVCQNNSLQKKKIERTSEKLGKTGENSKLGNIEENWAKLGGTGWSWMKLEEKLGKIDENWGKLGKTGQNWAKLEKIEFR